MAHHPKPSQGYHIIESCFIEFFRVFCSMTVIIKCLKIGITRPSINEYIFFENCNSCYQLVK